MRFQILIGNWLSILYNTGLEQKFQKCLREIYLDNLEKNGGYVIGSAVSTGGGDQLVALGFERILFVKNFSYFVFRSDPVETVAA